MGIRMRVAHKHSHQRAEANRSMDNNKSMARNKDMEIKAVMVINQIILDNTNEGKLFLFTLLFFCFFMLCPFTFFMFQLLAFALFFIQKIQNIFPCATCYCLRLFAKISSF